MRGINYSDHFNDGDLRECINLSARRWPYISTRRQRAKQEGLSSCTALTAWDKLITVQGTDLLYGGNKVGEVTAGAKQFAFVNTKLVIWPDKVIYDLESKKIEPMAASVKGSNVTFGTDSITTSAWGDLTTIFKAGDGIEITGCTSEPANNKSVVIKKVEAGKLTFSKDAFKEATESGEITAERKIPDMDFICESENRLWGCSTEKQTIYASSLGDPKNFNVFQGLATDSFAVAVGSEGPFTGCCKLQSSVLFWKETKLHKVLGSFPAEYQVYTYDIEGLQQGCSKSLQVINETLFYQGIHGVYAYTGGTPTMISDVFGEQEFADGVAGTDGDTYYLSVKDGDKHRLFCYETRENIWVQEDQTAAVDFARIGKKLYFLDSAGDVWLADSGVEDPDIQWLAQFTPFYETTDTKKRYSKLIFRVEVPRHSFLISDVRTDGGIWKQVGRIVGRDENTIPFRLPINRCDKFEIRLHGKGPCTIKSMVREFSVRSDR